MIGTSRVILASQSPQRRMAMDSLGVPFKVVPANIDEAAIQDSDLVKRAEQVARAKAETVHSQEPEAIILAADTYLISEGKALEKPTTLSEAADMLRHQSRQRLLEVTGVCYLDHQRAIDTSTTISTEVIFRDLSEGDIHQFLQLNEHKVLTWSGAFSPAYPSGAHLIDSIQGSYTGFTYGFPLEYFIPLLRRSQVLP